MYYDHLKRRVQALAARKEQERAAIAILDSIDVREHIASCYYDLHEDIKAGAHTVYNLPGGRGSCKSSFVSLEIVNGIMEDTSGHSNAIVFRYIANTMRESVYAQIAWAIDILGVNHLWRGGVSPMQFTYLPTGAQIVFRGLDDAGKLKSIKPKCGTFKYIWFEEFSELPGPNFLRSVQQSVMRGGSDFLVFRTFNPPISKNNWANVYIQEPDSKATTLLTDYTMIPPEWLGESFMYEAERLRELNLMAYLHEYMGQPTGTGGEVFPHLEIREITDEEISQMGYFYNGLDFGFAVDPACFMRVSYDRKHDVVYFIDEIYKRGCSNKQLAQLIKEKSYHKAPQPETVNGFFGQYVEDRDHIICDAAEPKSISDLREEGLMARKCHKKPGCVEYRVKWLQHRRIVIDPARTPNAYREFVNYSYEADRDGNFLPRLIDKDNHSIDAVAYALDRLIYRRGVSA